MTLINSRMMKKKCVYWAPGPPGDDGRPTFTDPKFSTPVELRCRWEDHEQIFIDIDGREQRSRARVYLDQNVQGKGLLYEGSLDSLTQPTDPTSVNAWEIKKIFREDTFRGNETLYTVLL